MTADGPVTVVAVEWHGPSCVTLTYRSFTGDVAEQLVYRSDESTLAIDQRARAWSFDADGELFRLVTEARRIRLAYLFDPRLAVHLSLLEPLPHQIQAVYGDIKELLLRGDLRRCLIVAPGSLVGQWQDDLADRFGLSFAILTRDMIEATKSGDPLAEHDLLIARLDHLARNDDLVERLRHTEWGPRHQSA